MSPRGQTLVKQVLIVQPYIPKYRVALFERLIDGLSKNGLPTHFLVGAPNSTALSRNDAAAKFEQTITKRNEVSLFGAKFVWFRFQKSLSKADVVVAEYSVSNLSTWFLALNPKSRRKLILWGHGLNPTGVTPRLKRILLKYLGNRAQAIAAYTDGGATALKALGVSKKVVGLGNTFDWESEYLPNRYPSQALPDRKSKTMVYLGSLDRNKHVETFAKVLDHMWSLDRTLRVAVAGDGSDAYLLEKSRLRGQTLLFGRVEGKAKAKFLENASVILMPGPVGLVAVDSLASGVPLVSMRNLKHGPEIEYMSEGSDIFLLDDDPKDFAVALVQLVTSAKTLRTRSKAPTVTHMASAFEDLVLSVVRDVY